jgi:hypothetical protein
MTRSQVARRDEPSHAWNGFDVAVNGRALSVAEIQDALRRLRAAPPPWSETPATRDCVATPDDPQAAPGCSPGQRALGRGTSGGDTATESRSGWGDTDPFGRDGWGDRGPAVLHAPGVAPERSGRAGVDTAALAPGWVTVLAAHSGAGASTVALAIADAAGVDDRRVHLMATSHPSRCGLVAASSVELGTEATGEWRRGARAHVTLDRRAAGTPSSWPSPLPGGDDLTLVDLGSPTPQQLGRIASGSSRVVLVCRPTVPGVRSAEQLLAALAEHVVVVAVVGPAKWPREVTSSAGPRLTGLRAVNRLVTVPPDRRLAVSGPTSAALPKPVMAAGRVLLGLIDDAPPGATAPHTQAPTVPGTKGISG